MDRSSTTLRRRRWVDREFEHGRAAAELPELLERLGGTPARLEERLLGLAASVLTSRRADRWSIQEHAGHLLDLEPVWWGRLDDLVQGVATLRAADIDNKATTAAGHNARQLVDLLHSFRAARGRLLQRLEPMTVEHLECTAMHPRLGQPMNVVDLCYFVAEHDDHHLAAITELLAPVDPRLPARTGTERLPLEFFRRVWAPPHDLSAIDELMTEDYVITTGGTVVRGRDAFKEWVAQFQRLLLDATNETLEIFANPAGDRVVSRWICKGINNGIFGLPADRRQVSFTGIAIWRVRDDRLAECWVERSAWELYVALSR